MHVNLCQFVEIILSACTHESLLRSPSFLFTSSWLPKTNKQKIRHDPPTTTWATPKKKFLPPSQFAVLRMMNFFPSKRYVLYLHENSLKISIHLLTYIIWLVSSSALGTLFSSRQSQKSSTPRYILSINFIVLPAVGFEVQISLIIWNSAQILFKIVSVTIHIRRLQMKLWGKNSSK